MNEYTHYYHFPREKWRELEVSKDQILTQEELEQIRGLNDRISLSDISEIYLPLIKLIAIQYHEAIFIHGEKMEYLKKKRRTSTVYHCAGRKCCRWKKYNRTCIKADA